MKDRDTLHGPTDNTPIPKDSTIFCPGCGTGLYNVVQRVFPETLRYPENFESLTENEVGKYPLECPDCKRLVINSSGQFTYTPPYRRRPDA